MHCRFSRLLMVTALASPLLAWGQRAPRNGGDFSNNTQPDPMAKVPAGVILVKGAWASASDSVTPVPEGGSVISNVFRNPYFALTYALPRDWIQKYEGPPPSDSGRYVLAQLRPADTFKGSIEATILITAQDMFFTPLPATNATQLINFTKDNLEADYKVEMQPTQTTIAGRPFIFFAYWSPAAELHWYILATQIRCHEVEIVLTSRDPKLLANLVLDLNRMELPAEASPIAGTGGRPVPVCIQDYARDENVIARVDPVFTERTFNAVPVRIIIDKAGKVKHSHFLSAFPDQARAISNALGRWRFKPYLLNGQPTEVETGIMFGRAPRSAGHSAGDSTTE
jgi:hypothetical protein